MNEPIISPWVFYWTETMGQIRDVVNVVVFMIVVISISFTFMCLICKKRRQRKIY